MNLDRLVSEVGRNTRDTLEADSHADTMCAGSNSKTIYTTDQVAHVFGYNGKKLDTEIKIGSAATIYEHPDTGQRYCLVMHQALLFGEKMDHSLLSTQQCRAAGLRVEDAPMHFDQHSDSRHAIFGKVLGDDDGDFVELPFELKGTTSYLVTRKPTDDEVDGDGASIYPIIHLSDEAEWNPSSGKFAERERAAKRTRGPTGVYRGTARDIHQLTHEQVSDFLSTEEPALSFCLSDLSPVFDADTFARDIAAMATSYDVVVVDETGDWEQPEQQDTFDGDTNTAIQSDISVLYSGQKRKRDLFETNVKIVSRVQSAGRRTKVTPEELSRRWGIGLQTAIRTLQTTTQRGVRTYPLQLDRRVRTWNHHLKVGVNRCSVYTDTMFAKVTSIGGNKMAQVFVTDFGFLDFYPMKSRGEAGDKLEKHVRRYGIPMVLISDGAREETGGRMNKVAKLYHIDRALTEPYSPWQNLAESSINTLKKGIARLLRRTKAPRKLWSWAGTWVAERQCLIAGSSNRLDGVTPMEKLTGRMPDISEHFQFDFYQLVWYLDGGEADSTLRKKLGFVVGIAHDVGQKMVFQVLTSQCTVIPVSSVTEVTDAERNVDATKTLINELTETVERRIGDEVPFDPALALTEPDQDLTAIMDDEWNGDLYQPLDPELDPSREIPEDDDYSPEELDEMVGAQLKRFDGTKDLRGTVQARKRDENGKPIGQRDPNPLVDTRNWVIAWEDGSESILTHNIVADSIYSMVDSEGREQLLFEEIIDHRKGPDALTGDEAKITSPSGNVTFKLTTRGWKLLVRFKDGSQSWQSLKMMKDSYPVQVAEYAVANKIDHEPAFAWWVKTVLKKRDRIVAKNKSTRYWRKSHKFGIELPKTVKEALDLDKKNKNNLWARAIEKEYKNAAVAFSETTDPDKELVGYKEIKIHFVFDIKMDFTRKARLVADGSRTEMPAETCYSTVPARDSVRIVFLLAALNGLDIKAADIQNAYLTAQPLEKRYVVADGAVFGKRLDGKKMKVVRALYGMKTSGRAFRNMLSEFIQTLGFTPTRADPDVYRRPAMKPNGDRYYEYFIAYVDDILAISLDASKIMDEVQKTFTFKNNEVGDPDIYLGSQIRPFEFKEVDPVKTWILSADKYVANALKECKRKLLERDRELFRKVRSVMAPGYRPELDQSPELSLKDMAWYQEMIGVLRWAVELGRLDIYNAVTQLASQMASPREGHLEALLRIFAWLDVHPRSGIVADPKIPNIDFASFKEVDWHDYYPGAREILPPGTDMPEPLGQSVIISVYVDADHAGDRVTRRSHTGIIIYLNNMPVLWMSKKQSTVESSTFGSEYLALRHATEMIEGLRYKLRTFGVPIDGPAYTYCDNQSVVANSSRPESALKKKHCAVAYHRVREACAAGVLILTYCESKKNLADLLTKSLPGQQTLDLMYHIAY